MHIATSKLVLASIAALSCGQLRSTAQDNNLDRESDDRPPPPRYERSQRDDRPRPDRNRSDQRPPRQNRDQEQSRDRRQPPASDREDTRGRGPGPGRLGPEHAHCPTCTCFEDRPMARFGEPPPFRPRMYRWRQAQRQQFAQRREFGRRQEFGGPQAFQGPPGRRGFYGPGPDNRPDFRRDNGPGGDGRLRQGDRPDDRFQPPGDRRMDRRGPARGQRFDNDEDAPQQPREQQDRKREDTNRRPDPKPDQGPDDR